jgi:transposase
MMKISMIGVDLAKSVFQVHATDALGRRVVRRSLRRTQVERFFASLEPCIVGMEACAGAHHWARVLRRLGHEVRLMPPSYVKPYVKRNKTDGRDAEAVWEAMQRPTMRFVSVKSEASQAVLVLHRARALLVRQRTMAANALRAAFAEFGIVAAQGTKGFRVLIGQLSATDCPLPEPAREALMLLARQWEALDDDIGALDRRILQAARSDEAARRLMQVPCIGPIIASAMVAAVPDARVFRSGRGFAAWLGLTPRQRGTGGKHRSGPISKQGDRHLRSLLIIGASAQLRLARARGSKDPWLAGLLARRPYKVVAVALAAKTARIAWAMLAKGEHYCSPVSAAA